MIQKIQQRAFSRHQGMWRQQIVPRHLAENRRSRKIRCGHAHNRERRMMRINRAKFSGGDSFFQRAHQLIVKWTKVLPHDPVEFLCCFHCFTVYQPRVIRMRSQKVEIRGDELAQPFPRRSLFSPRFVHSITQLTE